MLIAFDCPKCLKLARGEVTHASRGVLCTECGWTRPINEGELKADSPTCCLVCGCQDLWRQKDFNQTLGVVIVGFGILLSTIFVAYMMPGTAMIVLMIFGLLDWILYLVLPDRLVCYRCHAQYRGVPKLEAPVFDLEVNERYRQEAIRMKQTENASRR
jgi:hypothetical protein